MITSRGINARWPQTNKCSSIFTYILYYYLLLPWASLVAQTVKNLPAMQETWVQSLRLEDPLDNGMSTYSSILAWKTPRTEKPGGLQSMGLKRIRHFPVTLNNQGPIFFRAH